MATVNGSVYNSDSTTSVIKAFNAELYAFSKFQDY